MAKERINPEFNIQRVVQPTANPVDIYYRPNLGEPDPSRQLQIVKALQELNPQLQRLSSDAMAYMISKEKDIGAMEAMQDDEATMRRKQAEYVEKSGGLAPWRFQSYLENAGERLVRDKYQNAMYAQMGDLSEPYNADKTIRDPSYVKAKMDEMYAAVDVPQTSYFMIRGAAKARAAVDESVLSKVEQMRVQKVKEATELQLEDNLASILETTPEEELPEAMAEGGRIRQRLDDHYKNGFGSGDEAFIKAFSRQVDGLAAENKFDQARAVVGFVLSNPVAGRKVGARNAALLKQKLEDINEREERYEVRQDDRDDRRISRETTVIGSSLRSSVIGMAGSDGYINLNRAQIVEMVKKELANRGVSDADRVRMLPDLVERTYAQVASYNQPQATNPNVIANLDRQIRTMTPEGAQLQIDAFESFGLISVPDANRLTKENEERSKLSPVASAVIDQVTQPFMNGSWSGKAVEEMEPEYRNTMVELGADRALEIREELVAWARQPENMKMAAQDPMAFRAAFQKEGYRVTKEAMAQLRTENADDLQRNDRRTGFDFVYKASGLVNEVDDMVKSVMEGIPAENPFALTQIRLAATGMASDKLREAYKNAPPGMAGTEKVEYLRRLLPDIGFQVNRDMLNGVGLPPDTKKYVESALSRAQTPPPTDVATAEGRAVPKAIQGRGLFSTQAATQQELDLYNAGQEYQQNFPVPPEVNADPATLARFSEEKQKIQTAASGLIQTMVSTKAGDYRSYMQEPDRDQVWWASGNRPAFVIRDDGLYTLPNNPAGSNLTRATKRNMSIPEMQAAAAFGDRTPDKYTEIDRNATAKYWAAKSLTGYTQEEVRNGKTSEGLVLAPQYRDPNSFLYFQSQEEYDAAVNEYNNSNGKSGYVAEVILPSLTGISAETFGEAQVNLLLKRKPTK